MSTFVLSMLISLLLSLATSVAGELGQELVNSTHSETKVVVLGDSLSAGYGIELSAAWPSLLQEQLLRAGYPVQVVNASISGETTKGGLSRIDKLLKTHQPKLVLIELGANDGLRGVPAKHAQRNLQGIIEKTLDAGSAVLVFEMKVPPNYGQKFAMQYDELYAEIGGLDHVDLVPFFLADVIFEPAMMQADGLHPTALAQPVLLEHVWPYVQQKLKKINLEDISEITQQTRQNCRPNDDFIAGLVCDKHGELNEILQ